MERVNLDTSNINVDELHRFYKIDRNGKKNSIVFDRLRIVEILRELGFFRFDTEGGTSEYVYISDNKIELTSEQKIIDAFEDYIVALPPREIQTGDEEKTMLTVTGRMLREQLYKNITSYFSCLDRLRPDAPIEIMQDDRFCKYFYFQNTAVRVTANGIEPVPYAELDKKIWANSIITRPFIYTEEQGDFEKFIYDISGSDENRKKSLMSLIGYLMHDFYEVDLRAVMFTDVNMSDAGKAAGGTGKGLLGKALMQMLNRNRNDSKYVAIGAKLLDFQRDTRYSSADMTTQLIHLEDLSENFRMKMLYNDITDGATIRRPYQIKPVIRYVKFMLTVNHTLELDGSSDNRRLVIFELANYYSDTFRPVHKFHKRFFESDWNTMDWSAFYSFMCRCMQVYLSSGIIEPEEVNFSERRLAESINEDFRYWFDDMISGYVAEKRRGEFVKNTLYDMFAGKYPAYNERRYRNAFTKWCKKFLKLRSIPFCEIRGTQDILIINPNREDFLKTK